MMCYYCFFFFSSRRRHTRWPRDWSSDVCSSDLVAGVGPGEALEDGVRGLVGIERGGEVALGAEHVADLVVRQGQVALPAGVAGVGPGEALEDRERGLVGIKRGGEVALGAEHVADLVVRQGQVALPAGVAGVGPGEADGKGTRLNSSHVASSYA